jgi:hypothetical protein
MKTTIKGAQRNKIGGSADINKICLPLIAEDGKFQRHVICACYACQEERASQVLQRAATIRDWGEDYTVRGHGNYFREVIMTALGPFWSAALHRQRGILQDYLS